MGALFSRKKIGIIGAMPPEIAKIKAAATGVTSTKISPFIEIFEGTVGGKKVVFSAAGVGTVFASSTATIMLTKYNVEAIVFTGVAGGLKLGQKVGDIIIGSDCVNYDMDCTRFLPFEGAPALARGELPFINWIGYPADETLLKLADAAPKPEGVTVSTGRIATGSIFVDVPLKTEMAPVWESLGNPLACEMECAAVAQVCCSFGKPFLGLRALSDLIEGDANNDFNTFTQEAADNLWPIVEYIIQNYVP